MCGIAGIVQKNYQPYHNLEHHLGVMNTIQAHRGPDDHHIWAHEKKYVGFAHRRLSIIDLASGTQPMTDGNGNWIEFNGEIYNYIELREELASSYRFRTTSDTEVILAAYQKWGRNCVNRLRGMFAFAIWDEQRQELFCVRDRFGIKPFYYAEVNGAFYFASEAKTLLPFLPDIDTDYDGLKDYFVFQFTLGEKTLFKNIKQLLPAHQLVVKEGRVAIAKYWEVNYTIDYDHTKKYFIERTHALLEDSIKYHLRSDVPVGAYLSGGIDSSLMAILARKNQGGDGFKAFNGKFSHGKEYDESEYAQAVASQYQMDLFVNDIVAKDFIDNIARVIYHLDFPVAGPGSFPQFMVSRLASRHLKVVLGGQGGDEIFGGYVRYLLAYFEQCIKGAIDGTMNNGNYIVTYESIIPSLVSLKGYIPLMREFWSSGLFEERDRRYFKLVSKANTVKDEINWSMLESYSAFEVFKEIFWGKNVGKESYFDSMTNFDFKTLLPALLQVEDRMSMAHGLESRVPMLDHPLIEFAATVPSNIKFENGHLKHLLRQTFHDVLPPKIIGRTDKMGFPVPLSEWMRGELFEFVSDIFSGTKAKTRPYLNPSFNIRSLITEEGKFNRKLWGFLSLELWQQQFHDRACDYRKMAG